MRISDWSSDVCSSDLERRYRQASGKRRFRLQLARGGQPVDDFAGPLQPTVELALRPQRLVQPQLALRLQVERSPKRRQAMEAPDAVTVAPGRQCRLRLARPDRAEARRGGKECVSTW